MSEPEPVARPSEILKEDAHTRLTRDNIAANAIAQALSERFGLVRHSTRYRLAHEAIDQARAEVEPIQRRLREFDALSRDEQAKAIVAAFRDSGMTLDQLLESDPE
jgi:cell fate (sporulation/competence/biofilm development) regulator YlbF (YheA/YmcA/DUF963 family)